MTGDERLPGDVDVDVVDSHGDGNGRRDLGVVALAVALLGAGAFGVSRDSDRGGNASPVAVATSDPAETPSGPAETLDTSVSTDTGVTLTAPGPTSISAEPLRDPRDTLLVVRDRKLIRLGDGPPREVGRTSSDMPDLIPVRGGTVVSDALGVAGSPAPVRFFPDRGAPFPLGSATHAFAALDRSTVWLGTASAQDQPLTLRRVDVRTATVRARTTVAPRLHPVGEVATGVVLSSDAGFRGSAMIWSPSRHRVVRRFGAAVGSIGARHVLVGPYQRCVDGCFDVVDVVTGQARRPNGISMPHGGASVSPDGRWVVAFATDFNGGLPRLVVSDVRAGVLHEIAAAEVSEDVMPRFFWARDSRTAYVTLSATNGGQVLALDVPTRTLRVVSEEPTWSLAVE